jgi:hypothetical protein
MHSLHKGEVLSSLVCTFEMAIRNFEAKVYVEEGA